MKHKLVLFAISISILSLMLPSKKSNIYLIKEYSSSCSFVDGKPLDGYKISLLAPRKKKIGESVYCGYELDKVFSAYTNNEKIKILEYLLSFEGDTSRCAKKVCNYGSKLFNRPKTMVYSTQIDALYLFTILTVSSYSSNYCPFPVLYDNETEEEINDDQQKISEIFKIYKNWLIANEKKRICEL